MTAESRGAWYDNPAERPAVKEVIYICQEGLAKVEMAYRQTKLHTVMTAAKLHRDTSDDRAPYLLRSLFDLVFRSDDERWLFGEQRRKAASDLIGHSDRQWTIDWKSRREYVADEYFSQAVDTFRREDRGGQEAQLIRDIAAAIEAVIAYYTIEVPDELLASCNALIDRPEYIAAIRERIEAGQKFTCIWGEAGTGKTTLAAQAAKALDLGVVINLRYGNEKLLEDDIVTALMFEGLQPKDWSKTYCQVMLRQILAGQPRGSLVIIDNLEDEDALWQLVPRNTTIPVIVTMRSKPTEAAFTTFLLHDFTDEQAHRFTTNYFPDSEARDVESLAELLGNRPLALRHALSFLTESPHVSMTDLVSMLAENITSGIELITSPVQNAVHLIRLYEVILKTLPQVPSTVLECFLAISGRSGVTYRELIRYFAEMEVGGRLNRAQFESGIRTLETHGLVESRSDRLVMHELTHEILRELTGDATRIREEQYLTYLLDTEIQSIPDDVATGQRLTYDLRRELLATSNLLDGWRTIYLIDRSTWVAIRTADGENNSAQTYAARYEILRKALYKLDYRTGKRSPLQIPEGRQLYWSVHELARRVRELYGWETPESERPQQQSSDAEE